MRKLLQALISLFLLSSAYLGNCIDSDLETIHQRILAKLMEPKVLDSQVETLINTLQKDGSWPEINYQDVSRTAFEHSRHTGNMVVMSRAYNNRDSKFYKSKRVLKTIESALDFWVENNFICDNWWHNQIGTPDKLVTVMLLVGDKLPDGLVDKAQPIIGRANLNASGARESGDRIKIAGILAKNLLFKRNITRFEEVVEVIEAEIKFATGRGMQHDFSFHHRHDGVNNTLSYGLQYAHVFAEWAAYVADTHYALWLPF